jgi:hypothetical protein
MEVVPFVEIPHSASLSIILLFSGWLDFYRTAKRNNTTLNENKNK